ncbi:DIS3-like exonuclease 1 [Stylophora pistillata]|uniref:DIS3-like exonuclease 1 n=1 Tax=Stylophora pistillata TaxID=50429 RepID=A0A2B4RZH6_STYPI|nr:DIS3-like exonuclease 1 [Stylophora pistillata]
MIKTNKLLRLKTKTGRLLDVVREHYLRKDVPCHSEVCAVCEQGNGTLLSSSLTHYVVPDCKVSRLFLEIFESPEIQGVIFFETVVNYVQHQGGRKLHSQLKNIVNDNRQQSIIFSNEFCDGAYVPREPGEPLEEWQWRCIYTGAVWYQNHLNQAMPIVILTEDQQIVENYGNKSVGVFVMGTEDYLTNFYSTCQSILELYYSLAAVNNDANESVSEASTKEYEEYLPAEVLEAGIKAGRYLQGCLNVNKHCAQDEAFVQKSGNGISNSKDSLDSDVLITGVVNRNRAVHGDIVVVELFSKSQWKGRSLAIRSKDEGADESRDDQSDVMPTGRVVGVVQRNWRDYVASFAENEETQGVRKQAGKIEVNTRVRRYARSVKDLPFHSDNGSISRSGEAGPIGDLETEIQALMVEHTLAAPSFTEAQLKELPTNTPESPWVMSEMEIAKRRDLRKSHLIFSIDPKGCEDVDDTLSVRTMKRGQIELGVHIADVSHFVRPGSLTDAEAKARSTTVYLADRRFDMLPEVLSADLCSLIGGVDRYAVSVLWVLDSEYNVVKTWFGRTVIRSSYKLFYEAAQAIADGETGDEDLIEDIPELQEVDRKEASKRLSEIRKTVTKLMDIARVIKTRRTIHGALELEGVEVQVQLGDKKDIKNLIPKKPLEIHETVAECMIFANHWVAKKIAEAFPSAALLVRSLATQAMSNALYFSTGSLSPENFFHYGLALDHYTHFTSPIRRYADVIVHRLLMAAVENDSNNQLPNNKELHETCHHINIKHRAAQNAQKESVDLFQCLFFQDLSEDDERRNCDAVIFNLRANGFLVFVPRYGLKGPVYLKDKMGQVVTSRITEDSVFFGPGSLSRHEFHITVKNAAGSFDFRLFDHVQVRISVAKARAHAQSLKLDLLSLETRQTPPLGEIETQDEVSHKMQRSELVKEVKSSRNDQDKVSGTQKLDGDFAKLKSEFGQTHESVSLYCLMQFLREMSLRDDGG